MRVLICVRPNAPNDKGGDWLQLQATLPHLRALGVHAEYTVSTQPDFSDYDLCLIWNTVEPLPALYYYFEARRQSKPVAIMPIHWSLQRYWAASAQWRDAEPDGLILEMEQLWREVHLLRQKILMQGADALLPLSRGEANCLVNDFQAPGETIRIVHYGIDILYGQGDPKRFVEQFGVRDFILCVGFLAPRKNQLNLLRALQDDPRPLVFLGDIEEPNYALLCERAAAQRAHATTLFLPRHDKAVVADAFAAARVHALVSWFDVGPLVCLEAALAGCPQVVTTECGMTEYLRDEVHYVDPADLEGIRRAIDAAWEQDRATGLTRRVTQEFTWEHSAREILGALEWTLAHPRTLPDSTLELVRTSDLTERQVTLGARLLGEQGQEVQASGDWAQASLAQAQAAESRAHAAEAQAQTAETRAQAAESRAQTAEAQAQAAETRARTAEAQAQTAETRARTAEAQAQTAESRAQTAEAHAQAAESRAQTAEAHAQAAESQMREAQAHARSGEAWAHELEAANREQKETLDRILGLPPVRAVRYLRNRLSMPKPTANGLDE